MSKSKVRTRKGDMPSYDGSLNCFKHNGKWMTQEQISKAEKSADKVETVGGLLFALLFTFVVVVIPVVFGLLFQGAIR